MAKFPDLATFARLQNYFQSDLDTRLVNAIEYYSETDSPSYIDARLLSNNSFKFEFLTLKFEIWI